MGVFSEYKPTSEWSSVVKRLECLKAEGFDKNTAARLAYPLVKDQEYYETYVYKNIVDSIFSEKKAGI